jgi:2-polyprenyl-3-methyl-5-hydroxy-6-metoxy-1,4-benzoquinol methylase
MTTPPTIKPDLKQLILQGLSAQYISESCAGGVETGNHYQSIWLGNEVTSGFRTQRYDLLDRISFEGKSVLDLGCNLGELSRAARDRGAALVDGFEYDPFFVEMASAINAYNGTTRVSFYQRDITDPTIYRDQYDIVLAFSVFIYVGERLQELDAITKELLVLETHRLDDNLESTYLESVSAYFPAFEFLGETEWGTRNEASVRRAVIAFARDEESLARALQGGVSSR